MKSCGVPKEGFSGQCPHTPSDDSSCRFSRAPGQHSVQAGKGSAPWAQLHFQGLRHIPYPLRGSQRSGLDKLWHVLTGKPWLFFPPRPGSSWRFSSLDLIPCSKGPILPPTPAPAGTNLHKASTFWGTLKTNHSKKPFSAKWQRQKMCSLGRERLQRAALDFPAAIRSSDLFEWWWLHENTSAEPSNDSSDVNRGKKQTEPVQSTEAAMGHDGGDARLQGETTQQGRMTDEKKRLQKQNRLERHL